MKQPDTAALRERLTSFTPERELEENMQKLERLLQETAHVIDVTREMLQEISAAKKEIHGIHMDLMHTVRQERDVCDDLSVAKKSADNIADEICGAVIDTMRNTVIKAKLDTGELEKLRQYTAAHIKAEEELLENHRIKLARHLRGNDGVWLSTRWLVYTIITVVILFSTVILWAVL